MFTITCEKNQMPEIKEAFIRAFSEMCLSGIDYYREDKQEMKEAIDTAVDIIDGDFCGFEDTEEGFVVENDSVYDIGSALAEELLDDNSFCDLFTNETVGATGKWVVEQIHNKYPNIGIDATIEYDDGHHDTMEEHVFIKNGEVASEWVEATDDEDDE